jgi:hypothetical protein
VRTDFSAGVESYDAARNDGTTRSLTTDVLKVDRFIAPNVYLTGQVHSAVSGGAGGYTSAFVGGGWLQPLGRRWHVAGELLAGAAGGGGVDSGGAVLQASVYGGFQFTPSVALRLAVGRIDGPRGSLSSTTVAAMLNFTYGVSAGD